MSASPATATDQAGLADSLVRLQQSLGIVTWVWEPQSGRTDWFGDLSPLIGLPAGSYGRSFGDWLACMHPDDVQASRTRFIDCLKGRLPAYRAEERVLWPDGSLHWLETSGLAIYGPSGSAVRMVGVVRDVSERKRQEQAVVDSERRLRALIEDAPIAIAMSRGEFISYGNARFSALFGAASTRELLGRPVIEFVAPAGRVAFAERSARRQAGMPAETTYEMTACRVDGSEFECQISLSSAALADGSDALVFVQDISERRRAEQAIRALNFSLEQRVAERTRALERSNAELAESRDIAEAATSAKGEFLANMSHEIRTPMNAILGLTDLALRVPALPQRAEGYLVNVRRAAESLLGLINDILDFSKIESGKLVVESDEFTLSEVLDRVTSMVALQASAKELDFLINTARDVPQRLVGDPLRLGQVLLNLCGNAVKFTERGEIVLVTVRTESGGGAGVRLRFAVRDTGIGIAPEQLDRLFKPFDQIDASFARKHGGTGLGLAICRQLVEMMGGEIGVRSQPGHGSEFYFVLPFGSAAGAEDQAAPEEVPARRVLVVDDSENAREILADQLAALGCRHALAASAEQALAMLQAAAAREPFDTVLLDWRMPQTDGFAAADAIRRLRLPVPPRLLLVTAYGDDAVAARARREGLAGYLAKPVTAPALRQALRDAMPPPSVLPAAPPAAPQADAGIAALRGRRLLLVEDNELNQIVAMDLLGAVAEADITLAHDGHQAVEFVRSGAFELVLMDVQMPGMDGYEATRLIRQLPQGATLPVVAMTAHAMARDRTLAVAAGMNDFVSKPFEPDELFAVIAKWLPAAERPAAPAPAASGSVDFGLGLNRCLGRQELQRRVIARFVATRADDASRLREALAAGDAAAIFEVAHGLVSSAGMIGAQRLSQLANGLQEAAADRAIGVAGSLAENFVAEHGRVLDELRAHLAVAGPL